MINPELAAGMVFLPVMASNESIEIVGAERYCSYTGYASSFRFNGDFRDVMPRDAWGRRRTHVIAIDALSQPGDDQFRLPYRVRELTKAYCGFLNSARLRDNAVNWKPFRQSAKSKGRVVNESEDLVQSGDSQTSDFSIESPLIVDTRDECSKSVVIKPNDTTGTSGQFQDKDGDKMGAEIRDELGIATGNWGCGVFGGNLPLKCMLQWLAASQARRPYLLYFSFQNPDAQRLQVLDFYLVFFSSNIRYLKFPVLFSATYVLLSDSNPTMFKSSLGAILFDSNTSRIDTVLVLRAPLLKSLSAFSSVDSIIL